METMAKQNYLQRRKDSGVYYFRKKIPLDLRDHYGKAEIKFSLKTKDHKTAAEKARVEAVKLDQEFEGIRRRQMAAPVQTLSRHEIDRLTTLWLHETLKDDEERRQHGINEQEYQDARAQLEAAGADYSPGFQGGYTIRARGLSDREYILYGEDLKELDERLRHGLAFGDTSVIEIYLDELLDEQDMQLDKKSESYHDLAFALMQTLKQATEMRLERHRGNWVQTPAAPPEYIVTPLHTPVTDAGGAGQGEDAIPLSAVFDKWVEERQPPEKTAQDFGAHINRFIALHGDLPVTAITKPHVREYKDAMLQYPARPTQAQRNMPLRKLLSSVNGDTKIRRLSARTVNEKSLGALSALLGWAMNNGYCDDNPALGIRAVGVKASQQGKRQPYSIDDLTTIFNFPVFTDNERPSGGAGEAAKWLPLLALFTGARLEELGQLLVSDIQKDEGVTFFNINNIGDGKSLKTDSSHRKIPLHPELVRLDFLEYVAFRQKTGADAKLFPDLKSNQGKATAAWSQWWGRYARKHGITDKLKVFHSFRHTVKDGFRRAGVAKSIYDAIQGHAASDVSDTYGLGYPLPILAEAMNKLEYPGLSLAHIQQS